MNEPAVTARGARPWRSPPRPGAPLPGPAAQGAARADDASLIELSGSQPEAFAGIFDRHAREIHRFAARRLGDCVAEDVVGEVFLTAFRRRNSYDGEYRDARPWLYGIATNVISRHRHAEARAYRVLARTGSDPVAGSPDEDVLARVAASAQRRALAAGLAKLHAADRDTLLLFAWGGLSYAETAHALRIPVGTVRSRLNRARAKLRAALGSTGPDPVEPAEGRRHE